MMVQRSLVLLFLVLSGCCFGQTSRGWDEIRWYGDGWATEISGTTIAYISGQPEDMGRQLFHLLIAPREKEMLRVFHTLNQIANPTQGFEKAFRDWYAQVKLVPTLIKYIPEHYQEEMHAFLNEGARLSGGAKPIGFSDLVLSNAMLDLGLVFGGCFSFALWDDATKDGSMWVGRNLDYAPLASLAAYQSLLIYNPDHGIPFATVGYPAFFGVMHGMNERGIVVTMNYSLVKPSQMTYQGIPFTMKLRQILQEAQSLEEAIEIVKHAPRTVGLSILLADANINQAVILETTAYHMRIRRGDHSIFAANQFHEPDMRTHQQAGWLASALRENRFVKLNQEWHGLWDIDHVIAALRENGQDPIFSQNLIPSINLKATIASMAFNPTEGQIWFALSKGSFAPDMGWIGIDLRKIWQTGLPGYPIGSIDPQYNPYTMRYHLAQQLLEDLRAGRYRQVLAALEPFEEELNRTSGTIMHYLMAMACYRTLDLEDAQAFFEGFVEDPEAIDDPLYLVEAYSRLGIIHDQKGNRQQAIRYYEKGLDIQIKDVHEMEIVFHRACKEGLIRPLIMDSEGMVHLP